LKREKKKLRRKGEGKKRARIPDGVASRWSESSARQELHSRKTKGGGGTFEGEG